MRAGREQQVAKGLETSHRVFGGTVCWFSGAGVILRLEVQSDGWVVDPRRRRSGPQPRFRPSVTEWLYHI